jgi:hypothetical protein
MNENGGLLHWADLKAPCIISLEDPWAFFGYFELKY